MAQNTHTRAHLVTGGFPAGATAGHDMDYARLRLLQMLNDTGSIITTVSSDFVDIERWLPTCQLLVTYVAGPFPDTDQCTALHDWLENGGRWIALHGTSGGKAARIPDSRNRRMVKMDHHRELGCFFLNHPPIRAFRVDVHDSDHPLTRGLPASFAVEDELYLIELSQPAEARVLLTTSDLPHDDPAPRSFGFSWWDRCVLRGGRVLLL